MVHYITKQIVVRGDPFFMRRLMTSQLIPGMVIAEDVYNFNNQLILSRGTVLTDTLITRLDMYSIIYVRIEETAQEDEPLKLPVKQSISYSERVKQSPEFAAFKEKYTESLTSFRDKLNSVVEKNITIDIEPLLNDALSIVNSSNGSIGVFDMLQNMRQYDDSTYSHCLNVALICNVFGKWLNMTPSQIELATTCGLLHDIGKLKIPNNIITKPGKLSDQEFAIIKRHPAEGFRILKNAKLNAHICNSALMHHEKCDGSGYPLGLSGDKIDPYAKMVTIADIYDAMTSARIYRGPLCPFMVIELFESEGLQKYDTKFILTFLESVVNTYIGNRVRLSNGQEGEIIFINRDKFSRPTIKCGEHEYIALSERLDLTIDCLI